MRGGMASNDDVPEPHAERGGKRSKRDRDDKQEIEAEVAKRPQKDRARKRDGPIDGPRDEPRAERRSGDSRACAGKEVCRY